MVNSLEKTKMATAKMQTQGFKTVVHKPMGGATTAMSIILYSLSLSTQSMKESEA